MPDYNLAKTKRLQTHHSAHKNATSQGKWSAVATYQSILIINNYYYQQFQKNCPYPGYPLHPGGLNWLATANCYWAMPWE
jgi:hypothetical protein